MSSPVLPPLYRPVLSLFVLALPLATVPALHASPITYQMTFNSGGYTGTGTLTLASQPSGAGVTDDTVPNQQVQSLVFTVGDQTFNFSTDPSASVQFVNGQISKINLGQAAHQPPAPYTVDFANGFSLYDGDSARQIATGSYTITPEFVSTNTLASQPTSPTPEPRSLFLLATALFGGGFLLFRRKRAVH